MEEFIRNLLIMSIIALGIVFMSRSDKKEKIENSDVIVFDFKKNIKIVLKILCFFLMIVLPIFTMRTIIEEKNIGVMIFCIVCILYSLLLLIVMKYQKIVYKNGVFKKKNILGKTKIYKFDEVVRAKYSTSNYYSSVILYTKNKEKLQFTSYHNNIDWVLKEIKIRNIEIYN